MNVEIIGHSDKRWLQAKIKKFLKRIGANYRGIHYQHATFLESSTYSVLIEYSGEEIKDE